MAVARPKYTLICARSASTSSRPSWLLPPAADITSAMSAWWGTWRGGVEGDEGGNKGGREGGREEGREGEREGKREEGGQGKTERQSHLRKHDNFCRNAVFIVSVLLLPSLPPSLLPSLPPSPATSQPDTASLPPTFPSWMYPFSFLCPAPSVRPSSLRPLRSLARPK
jgi:hypothetical protein